jgi:hypothetical protein
VLAVFTAKDLAGIGGLPCGWLIKSIDGSPMKEPMQSCFCANWREVTRLFNAGR